jgi:glycolate oxidase iron-sulfur subunit
MVGLAKLGARMKALEDRLMACMRCGLCQSVCPLFAETGREADVARGKLALLDGLSRDLLKDARGVRRRLDHCLLCGSCAANCPSGVNVLEIFLEARAVLSGYLGLSPAKRLIFRQLLAKPALFDRLLAWAPRFQHLFTKPADQLLGTSCARLPFPLGNRHFKGLAPTPFHVLARSRPARPAGTTGPTVAWFTGCVIDKVYPQVAQAALKALDHHRIRVLIPESQACCGIPALSSGDTQAFETMLRHNLARFQPDAFDCLVTACASCTATIKGFWPLMSGGLTDTLRDRVALIAAKTMDISQFLVTAGLVGREPAAPDPRAETVTYHDPCHLAKTLGVSREPRLVIQANPKYRLVEMREADRCCGMGGSFNLEHYETSAAIGRRKADNILASGGQTVATSCPACLMQITDALSRDQAGIKVRHAIEIYAEGL